MGSKAPLAYRPTSRHLLLIPDYRELVLEPGASPVCPVARGHLLLRKRIREGLGAVKGAPVLGAAERTLDCRDFVEHRDTRCQGARPGTAAKEPFSAYNPAGLPSSPCIRRFTPSFSARCSLRAISHALPIWKLPCSPSSTATRNPRRPFAGRSRARISPPLCSASRQALYRLRPDPGRRHRNSESGY